MLAKEQYIGAGVLLVIIVATWLYVALGPHQRGTEYEQALMEQQRVLDSLRQDSIAQVRARRDSLREARWQHLKDSFDAVDSLRFKQWATKRQARYDSARLADSLWRDSVGLSYKRAVKKDTILDLNTADTTELQYIRGIGQYKAKRIIAYREQLGGFYSTEQLGDEDLRELGLDSLRRFFAVTTDSLRTMDVNRCSVSTLSRHPYLRYTQAKAIYQLRRQRINLRSIEDLRVLSELDSTDIARLQYYLRFEP
ncbi:MAG: helix-hairpin-helix domain-containing protein [Paludibacteraceae bacterium]|nr:helix-hairpin-helix domain-containing protein [Paludibacteraceae bacterium]